MFEKVRNASLYLRNHLCWKLFYIKNAGCVSTMLLQKLCKKFFGNFAKYFRIATLQNSERVLQISPDITVIRFPCLTSFKKYV